MVVGVEIGITHIVRQPVGIVLKAEHGLGRTLQIHGKFSGLGRREGGSDPVLAHGPMTRKAHLALSPLRAVS